MRIGIDIDSTLHDYWPVLVDAARRRFGVELPYEKQVTWEIPELRPEQLRAVIQETHDEEHILAAVPYPGAVDAVNAWHAAGHFIHITSHRRAAARDATERWLAAIGMRYDELYCSQDKVARAQEIGLELFIDDSPDILSKALAAGMTAATLVHPWNEDICEEEDIVCAPDWPTLRARLRPLLEAVPS
jgi:phosphoglycolate phosphatase-like HAD superfamily hydrolase